jgi:RNA polymerase sigma factor (TIGR02999 family)
MLYSGPFTNKTHRERESDTTAFTRNEVSVLLADWSKGDEAARDKLIPLVYAELRKLAQRQMAQERPDHSLQATALVNEAYLRLVDHRNVRCQNRAHFFALAAQMMRHILTDHARRRIRAKRGGGVQWGSLEQAAISSEESTTKLVALDEALKDLAAIDPRRSRVVELRYFGGLSVEETAEVLKVSAVTVMRDWTAAKAWLYRAIKNVRQRTDES